KPIGVPLAARHQIWRISKRILAHVLNATCVCPAYRTESPILSTKIVVADAPLGGTTVEQADATTRNENVKLVTLDPADVGDLHHHLLALNARCRSTSAASSREPDLIAGTARNPVEGNKTIGQGIA